MCAPHASAALRLTNARMYALQLVLPVRMRPTPPTFHAHLLSARAQESYPAGSAVPLRLTLTSTSLVALELLSAPHAPRVTLRKVVQFGTAAGAVARRAGYHHAETVGTPAWRTVHGPYALPGAHRWRTDMAGEFMPTGSKPFEAAFEVPGMAVMVRCALAGYDAVRELMACA
jgi:hypothetical protein